MKCKVFERVGISEVDKGWTLYAPDVIPLGFDASFLEEPIDCLHCGSDVHISSFIGKEKLHAISTSEPRGVFMRFMIKTV